VEPRVLQHDEKGEGEPIVLVRGGLTGWPSWIPHQERLADRYGPQPVSSALSRRAWERDLAPPPYALARVADGRPRGA
jgi:hypothetical protein